jgi:predicted O-methyltransferase YrrM
MGFHLTPNHYYQPIPQVRKLHDDLWMREFSLTGIDMNIENQIQLLHQMSSKFRSEYDCLPTNRTKKPYQYYLKNQSFKSVDGEMLYCMIRHFKPKRLVEIGSGCSTYLSAQAMLVNEQETGHKGEFVAIDPYPNDVVKNRFPGLSQVIQARIEDIGLPQFKELRQNDILFIDSTHVLKIGSDVQYLYLEVLPKLEAGVIVHIHDIFLPREYPKEWLLRKYIFWNEQYLLAAFLAFNNAFEVLWAANLMHTRYPQLLEEAFRSYDRSAQWIGPGSFWIRRKS